MNYIALSGITDNYPIEHDYWLLTPGCDPKFNDCKLNYSILGITQDPFNTPISLHDGYVNIKNISDTLISLLSCRLNKIHNVEYSERYWRIHLGIWVTHYVLIIYHRSTKLYYAKKTLNNITVIGAKYSDSDIQNTTNDFVKSVLQDSFNLKMCTKISEKLNIPIEYVLRDEELLRADDDKGPSKKNIFLNLLRGVKNIIFKAVDKYFLKKSIVLSQQPYLPAWFQLALFISTLGKIGFLNRIFVNNNHLKNNESVNHSARSSLSLVPDNTDNLTALIISLVGNYIPKVFLEGYDELSIETQKIYSRYSPKAIYSANSWWHDELFKNWAALSQENGVKLIGGTHGGGAFLHKYKIWEDLESSLVDHYVTWGWKVSNKDLPFPANKLISFYKLGKKSRAGFSQILYVTTCNPRHNYNSLEKFSDYFEWQVRFLKNVSEKIEKNMLIRPYFADWGWKAKENLINANNAIKHDNHEFSFHSRIKKSKVCVYDYISTTFVESLSMNIPTIIFVSRDIIPICKEMVNDFDALRRVSILHDSPESAMDWLDSMYDEIDDWWLSDDCQNVVQEFCSLYARRDTVKNSLSEWSTLVSLCK